jgi:hypothetical protein
VFRMDVLADQRTGHAREVKPLALIPDNDQDSATCLACAAYLNRLAWVLTIPVNDNVLFFNESVAVLCGIETCIRDTGDGKQELKPISGLISGQSGTGAGKSSQHKTCANLANRNFRANSGQQRSTISREGLVLG